MAEDNDQIGYEADKNAAIGWTRQIWVFVNGKLVYADLNLFDSEEARKIPDG